MAQLIDLSELRARTASQGAASEEAARRRLVKLTLIIFLLLIFEGVLRKWVFPQYSRYLFFVRDPFVIFMYLSAARSGIWPRANWFLTATMVLAVVSLVIMVIQAASGGGGNSLLLAGYGWRNYFLYIPFAFLVARIMNREDVARLARYTFLIAVPVAFLVVVQFFSPGGATINSGIAVDGIAQGQGFPGAAGHIRPNGTFTAVTGQWMFVVSTLALLLANWITPRFERMVGFLLLSLATAAGLTCLAFSLSRGMFVSTALVLLSALVAASMLRQSDIALRAWLFPVFFVGVGALLFPVVFPEAFHALSVRVISANAAETRYYETGLLGRALSGYVRFISMIPRAPIFGFGMGMGGNASGVLGGPQLAEDEWSRQIVDLGPIFGVLFIALRVAFTCWLAFRAIRAVRELSSPLPALLFGFVGILILNGQVTGQGSINGYAWMFAGVLMATFRWAEEARALGGVQSNSLTPPQRGHPVPRAPSVLRRRRGDPDA